MRVLSALVKSGAWRDGTVLYWVLAGVGLALIFVIAKPGRRH